MLLIASQPPTIRLWSRLHPLAGFVGAMEGRTEAGCVCDVRDDKGAEGLVCLGAVCGR
jgi:hypothetical protein